jgi:hypothetical protein
MNQDFSYDKSRAEWIANRTTHLLGSNLQEILEDETGTGLEA